MAGVVPAPLKWAQRRKYVYVTSPVTDPIEPKVMITDSTLLVEYRTGDGKSFQQQIELFGPVSPQLSGYIVHARLIVVRLHKAVKGDWGRLTRDTLKRSSITADWELWKDEDELTALPDDDGNVDDLSSKFALDFNRMSNGVSICGGGDPQVVAKLQQDLLKQ